MPAMADCTARRFSVPTDGQRLSGIAADSSKAAELEASSLICFRPVSLLRAETTSSASLSLVICGVKFSV